MSFTTLEFPTFLPAARRGDHWVARAGRVELRLTNLEKIFWPETGYTKGDLLSYYFNVAPYVVSHVEERPLTLKRQPEGVAGPYWYAKDVPSYAPQWMPTLEIEAERPGRTIRFATICDVASLLWIANLGCIELHPHHSRGNQQKRPSYAVFDLDPFHPADFNDTRYVARLVKSVLDQLELASYPKTSGGTGMQIYVPLDGASEYELVRAVVARICRLVHRADPEATTLEWEVSRRAGRVYLDANMNRAGASFSAPYSVRAKWNAPVSMPFAWDELDTVDPHSFTIANGVERIVASDDVFAPVARPGVSLMPVASRLGLSTAG